MSSDKNRNSISSKSSTSRFVSKLGKFLLVIFSFLMYLTIVPIFILLVSPLYLYRFFVIFLAKLLRRDLIKIVCTRDAVVGLDDVTKKCICMLNLMLILKGEPDIQLIREVFHNQIMEQKNSKGQFVYRKFKYFYESWLGFAFWKQEDNFQLSDHIRLCEETEIHDLNSNSESIKEISEQELIKIIGPICTRPFAPKTSPWELLVVRNYTPAASKIHERFVLNSGVYSENSEEDDEKKFALIFRVHHALGDGYSLLKLILTSWADVPSHMVPKPKVIPRSFLYKLCTYFGIVILSPYYHLKQFVLDVDKNFWHLSANKLTREWHAIMSERICLNSLKEISKAQKVSTTAVLLAGFGGAVRKFLQVSGHEKKIPKVMRSIAPMPWKNHPMDALVNHWTLGNMVLPVGSECPKERLQVAEKSIRILKQSPVLFTNFGTVPLLLGGPSWLTDIWATNWMTTMILSNFPGPTFAINTFKSTYPAVDVTFWLPQMRGSASLGVSFMSYNGGIRISATIDKAIMPHSASADLLTQLINEEFKSLQSLASEVIA